IRLSRPRPARMVGLALLVAAGRLAERAARLGGAIEAEAQAESGRLPALPLRQPLLDVGAAGHGVAGAVEHRRRGRLLLAGPRQARRRGEEAESRHAVGA